MLETMLKSGWNRVAIGLKSRCNYDVEQISYETFFQRRFNVSLLFFNVVSALKQLRRCACWDPPPTFGKYFKMTPKLAKIKFTKKILASPHNPGRPFFSDPGSATASSI